MSFDKLFRTFKETFMRADVSEFDDKVTFEFQVNGEGEGVFSVEIVDGDIIIEPTENVERDALLIASGNTIWEICQGNLDPMLAFAVGRMKIVGNIQKAKLICKLYSTISD